jgi:phosphoribosylcarboxyaminoimidazole (NCAIR) mutase
MEKTPLPDIELEPGEVTYVSIRSKVEAADDALTQAILSAQTLSEHTDTIAVAHAMRDAELADAVAGKAATVADLLRASVTPPVVG